MTHDAATAYACVAYRVMEYDREPLTEEQFEVVLKMLFLRKSKNPENLMFLGVFKEAQTGFEPVDTGVADHCLTTWLLCHSLFIIDAK